MQTFGQKAQEQLVVTPRGLRGAFGIRDRRGTHEHRNDTREGKLTDRRSLEPGLRTFPLELGVRMGLFSSKKWWCLGAAAIMERGGRPSTSIMHCICSTSFSPGNRG
jgi:hypothetical protein